MKIFELNGTPRTELGKKATKALRRNNLIPCELYGGDKNVHFIVSQSDVRKLIYTPDIFMVKLTVGDHVANAIVKDLQFHPVTDSITHMDFVRVFDDKEITVDVPVKLEGLAAGVKAGGKLQLIVRKLHVKAMHQNVPERLVINVENVELGKTIMVRDLKFDNLQILNTGITVVCAVKLTRAARGEKTTDAAPAAEAVATEA